MHHLNRQSTIPLAHSGEISNDTLEQLIRYADDAAGGKMTDETGTLLLLCAPGIFREALMRRRAMDVINDLSGDNLIMLHPGGDK